MTTLELNSELFYTMGQLASDEGLMKKLLAYAKKLVAKKQDETLMTKDEFFAKLDRAERQIARGEGMEMLPNEDLTAFLNRNGYAKTAKQKAYVKETLISALDEVERAKRGEIKLKTMDEFLAELDTVKAI